MRKKSDFADCLNADFDELNRKGSQILKDTGDGAAESNTLKRIIHLTRTCYVY
jgi:hypothetical protein